MIHGDPVSRGLLPLFPVAQVVFCCKAQVIDGNVSVQGRIVMHGQRDLSTGLWTVLLDTNNTKQNESINSVYEISKVYDTIQYLHAAAGSPVPSTFVKAIKAGNLTTWPTLTPEHVNKYLEKSEATVKGHLNQTSKNVRSTKTKKKHTTREEKQDYKSHITEKMNVIYAAIHEVVGHTYTNLTGRFPKTSSRGYKYILVLYDYDGNSIQAEPVKNRSYAEAIRAYSRIYDELTAKGLKPKFQTMDNEASTALKHFLHSKDIRFQLVPPHCVVVIFAGCVTGVNWYRQDCSSGGYAFVLDKHGCAGGGASAMYLSVVSGLHSRGPSNLMLNCDGRWPKG
jgi:hypothetical protein